MNIPWLRIGKVAGLALILIIGVVLAVVALLGAMVGAFWLMFWIGNSKYGYLIILVGPLIVWAVVAAFDIVKNAESEGKSIFRYIKDRA